MSERPHRRGGVARFSAAVPNCGACALTAAAPRHLGHHSLPHRGFGRARLCLQRVPSTHFAYHSCNHKACPQCGALATRRWVAREVHKLINAPYFLVTFTLPSELRGCFFGPLAKLAYDLFFTAVHTA